MEEPFAGVEVPQAFLDGRLAVYTLLARVWAEPLDTEAQAILTSSRWEEVLAPFDEAADSALVPLWREVAHVAARLGTEGCVRAFNWCFMGIGTRVAPWESVYATGERLVMQPSTLAVREAYASAGFTARNKGSEPDDHVATECDFMAKMAERAADAASVGDKAACAGVLRVSRLFLRDHLAAHADGFADAFAEAAEKGADDGASEVIGGAVALYGSAARFAAAFYRVDEALLTEMLD